MDKRLSPLEQPTNQMTLPPIAERITPPTPEQVRTARVGAGLTQTQAAQLVFGEGSHVYRKWNQYEAPTEKAAHRPIPLATWELFLLLIGQHPRFQLSQKKLKSFREKEKRLLVATVQTPLEKKPISSGDRGKESVLARYPHAVCIKQEGNFGWGEDIVRHVIKASTKSNLILGYGKRESWAWTQASRNIAREK
jgi:hypothetical protein